MLAGGDGRVLAGVLVVHQGRGMEDQATSSEDEAHCHSASSSSSRAFSSTGSSNGKAASQQQNGNNSHNNNNGLGYLPEDGGLCRGVMAHLSAFLEPLDHDHND